MSSIKIDYKNIFNPSAVKIEVVKNILINIRYIYTSTKLLNK